MNQRHFLQFLIFACLAASPISACAAESATVPAPSGTVALLILLLVLGLAGAAYWFYQWHYAPELPPKEEDDAFCEHRITQTFISALPSLTRELNLEIARTQQTEILEKSDTRRFLGLDLGTNSAQIRMPVTYRYHLRLQDPWTLSLKGKAIVVYAPMIRASQPPAIHTDQMSIECKRGWCRLPPYELADQLHHELTPILSRYAEDPRRVQFIREAARQSVAEFVRLWLEREHRWNRWKFTSIHVRFRDEDALPAAPTLQLLSESN